MTNDTPASVGNVIRERLANAGYSIPAAAVAICLNRSNLNNVILSKVSLTHDMAYRINALVAPEDEEFDLARQLLGLQADFQWNEGATGRRLATVIVKASRRYGDKVEKGQTAGLTLTAAGVRQREEDLRTMGHSPLG